MTLRRVMDRRYREGLQDARLGKRPNPAHFGEVDSTYQRWAYDAGWREGRREFEKMHAAMKEYAGS